MNLREALQDEAKKFSEKAHKGQTRKFADEPYSNHPNRVAGIVKRFKSSHKIDQLVSAALLHDTIEDTGTTEEDLHKLFGGLTASLVKELTSDPKGIDVKGKTKYLSDKMKSMSSWALVVKLADRLDNVSDLKNATAEFAEKYSGQTRRLLKMLKQERKLTNTQQKLVNAIEEKLDELNDSKNEAFEANMKGSYERDKLKTYEIFSNPTKKEIASFGNSLRFIADEKKRKLYIFSENILHYDAARNIDGLSGIKHQSRGIAHINQKTKKLVVFDMSAAPNTHTGQGLAAGVRSGKHWASKWFTPKINEEFQDMMKVSSASTMEIFVNPTLRELQDIKKASGSSSMRFILDEKKKKLYAWEAEILHRRVSDFLGIPYRTGAYGFGVGVFNGKQIEIDLDSLYSTPALKKALKNKKHWANKWLMP